LRSADGYYVFQGSPNEVILSPLANAAVRLKTEDFRLVHPVADAVMVFVTAMICRSTASMN